MHRAAVVIAAVIVGLASAPAVSADDFYPNCEAVRAAGAAPLFSRDLGYRLALDRDRDGTACEGADDTTVPGPAPAPPASAGPTGIVHYEWATSIYSVTFLSSGWVW